jgi:carboxyl-terminal processing protease
MEEESKLKNIYERILTIVLTASIVFVCTTAYFTHNISSGKYEDKVVYTGEFDKLERVKNIIKEKYLMQYDEKKLVDGAVKGMLATLDDPYTTYFSEEEWEQFAIETEGEYDGVGMYITVDTDKGMIRVISPIRNSPAEAAGVLPGDYIKSIDGVVFSKDELNEASSALKGKSGSTVKVEFIRISENGEETRIEKTLTRQTIDIDAVEEKVLENNIGYIKLATFDETAYSEFVTAYNQLIKKDKVSGLIIDLRNNPGGLLNIATDIADMLVPKGDIVYTLDKNGVKKVITSDAAKIEVPLVLLVNEGSASASEILAGAVRDHGVGILVGTKTYGKGVVQELQDLKDGTVMKITSSEYFTPKGVKINKVGLTPDVVIDLPEDLKQVLNLTLEQDVQLQKAIEELKKNI